MREPVARHEIRAPARRFPLIRHVSWRLTAVLVRLPVTPNQLTIAAMIASVGAAALLARGDPIAGAAGGAVFFASEVLCHCDGEVARVRGLASRLGNALSEFGGFLSHTLLVLALGVHAHRVLGDTTWLWLGGIAALGSLLNYVVTLVRRPRHATRTSADDLAHTVRPEDVGPSTRRRDRAAFALRHLADADFSFVVLALALAGVPWLLLPPAAIGAHVFWMAGLLENARSYRA